MNDLLPFDTFRTAPGQALDRFRAGRTHAFTVGDRLPRVVVLTYEEYEDLGGHQKFPDTDEVLTPDDLMARLPDLLQNTPILWGEGHPEAVLLKPAEYRHLRGDDEPPPGVVDDPTQRTYDAQPLPDSKPFSLDEIAELMGPEATQDLEDLRRDSGSP